MITEYKFKVYDRILGTISALAIIFGGIWTVNTFHIAREKERKDLATQDSIQNAQQLQQTKQLERQVKVAIYNEKKSIYYELCDAEAEIAACQTPNEVLSAEKHFYILYYGKAHIIAQLDSSVFNQKIRFMHSLKEYIKHPNKSPEETFGTSSLELSLICSEILNVDSLNK